MTTPPKSADSAAKLIASIALLILVIGGLTLAAIALFMGPNYPDYPNDTRDGEDDGGEETGDAADLRNHDEVTDSAAGSRDDLEREGSRQPALHECIALAMEGEDIHLGVESVDNKTLVDLYDDLTGTDESRAKHLVETLSRNERMQLVDACVNVLANFELISIRAVDADEKGLHLVRIDAIGPHGFDDDCTTDENGACQIKIPAYLTYDERLTHNKISLRAVHESSSETLLTSEELEVELRYLLDAPAYEIQLEKEMPSCSVNIIDAKTKEIRYDVDSVTAVFQHNRVQKGATPEPGPNRGKWLYPCPVADKPGMMIFVIVCDGKILETEPMSFLASRTLKWEPERAKQWGGKRPGILEPVWPDPKPLPPGEPMSCREDPEVKKDIQNLIDNVKAKIPADCKEVEVVLENGKVVSGPVWLQDGKLFAGSNVSCQGTFSCPKK